MEQNNNQSKRIKVTDLQLFNKWRAYSFQNNKDTNSILIFDNQGFCLEKKEMKQLIEGLENAINSYDDDLIKNYNKKLYKKLANEFDIEDIEYSKPKTLGYIYFATYNNEYYKIGRSKNIPKRLKQFSVEMPFDLEVIHYIKSNYSYDTEKLFHEYFTKERIKGEWFKLSKADIEYIKLGKYTKKIMDSIGGANNE